MTLLLDTHVFLWALMEPDRLSRRVRGLLLDPGTQLLVSAASGWEVATKYRLGKLPGAAALMADYAAGLAGLDASVLPISNAHALAAGSFSQPHRDPFDRMLAAQAKLEMLPLATQDAAFNAFGIELLW